MAIVSLKKYSKESLRNNKKSTVSIINYISKRTREGGSMINNLLHFYHTRKNDSTTHENIYNGL